MNIDIRKLTFEDKDEMDEVLETQTGFWNSAWSRTNDGKAAFAWNWKDEGSFNPNVRGLEHFGLFHDDKLMYIKTNKYHSHPEVYSEARQHTLYAPFCTTTTIGRKGPKERRLAKDGKMNLDLIELQDYSMIHGSEARGINNLLIVNAADPRKGMSAKVSDGREWRFTSSYYDSDVQSRRASHYHCICLEEIGANQVSDYEWVRRALLNNTYPHTTRVFMFVRHYYGN